MKDMYLGYFEEGNKKIWVLSKNLEELKNKGSKKIFELNDEFGKESGSITYSKILDKYKLIYSE